MFAYNPVTQNKSGEIYAKNIMYSAEVESEAKQRAAEINSQAQQQMVGDIGGALMGLAGAYGDASALASQGDSAYEALGALGEMYPGMKGTHGALGKLDPRTRRMAAISILDNLGAVSQLGIAGMNNQTRVAQQGLTAAGPANRAAATAAGRVASGQGTINRSAIGYNPAAIRRNNPTGP
jgi:alkylhydroperoxidase/carboxymuconolactone decarboxylase family protein YurZ